MTTAAPTSSGGNASGATEDKRLGILAEVIGAAAVAGVITQLIAYFVANRFYSGYGLNASVIGITPFNAAFRLSQTWIWAACLILLALAVVFAGTSWELRKIETGDPAADKDFLMIAHNSTSSRFLRMAIASVILVSLCGPILLLGMTSQRLAHNYVQDIDAFTLTPNLPLPIRLIETAANFILLRHLALDLLPSKVEVPWPTIAKVPTTLSDEWSPLPTDTAAPAPPGATPGPATGIPLGPAPTGVSTDDNGGSSSAITQTIRPTKTFAAQWLGDDENFHVLYFPDYKKTLFVKIDDVSMSVNLPRN